MPQFTTQSYPYDVEDQTILVVDDDVMVLQMIRRTLNNSGFANVLTTADAATALVIIDGCRPALALVDLDLGPDSQNGIGLIKQLKPSPDGPIPVVLSGNKTQEQFFKAARAGAVDYFVKGPCIDLSKEVRRLLNGERGVTKERSLPEIVSDLGYLRSFGLTRKEIEILTEFANGFPKISDLAKRQQQPPIQVRKYFSSIYEKLNITDIHQLIRTLMICEFFNRDN